MNSDIYPLDDKQRAEALSALYNECMKQYGVSPPAPVTTSPAPVAAAAPPASAPPVQTAPVQTEVEVEHHKAVSAPVAPVTIENNSPSTMSVSPPPPVPTAPVTPPAAAPFAPAVPPSPALAAKIHRPPVSSRAPSLPPASPDDNGKTQLESILNQQ